MQNKKVLLNHFFSMGTTRPVLVTVFGRKPFIFGDETCSRHRFEAKNALFWRRDLFSSPF
ncbi:hypothetical protein QPM05_13000 [Caldibacillus thermoamylovorans]|nr:hypothetical protein [Caldibacillus thermoamylovorans]